MTDEEELQMATSIRRWRREQPMGQRRRQEREIVPRAESWEEKYDRLWRSQGDLFASHAEIVSQAVANKVDGRRLAVGSRNAVPGLL